MNGAEALVRTLIASGVSACFSNPGTSEIHIVAALDRVREMRCVLGLFEGVVTAAADGYGRMTERPGCTLLHLGPGLANGLANLHNAKRARAPIVNIVGQHALTHLHHDTPLTSDIEAIARPFSNWVRTSSSTSEIGGDAASAVASAMTAPGKIATLIVPADVAWSEGGVVAKMEPIPAPPLPATEVIDHATVMLRSGLPTAIILDGNALYGQGLAMAGRIAAGCGAKLLCPYPLARMERGAGLAPVERIHYILEQATEQLGQFRQLILVGARTPVAYFAYAGKNSVLTSPECEVHTLASPGEDYCGALEALAGALSLLTTKPAAQPQSHPSLPQGPLTLQGVANAVGVLLPENAIVVDESMTSGRGLMAATRGSRRHDWLGNTGGAIGIALPLALGAAIACPDRRVLCFTADGSAMYTAQALWTMAREQLKITTVVFANRSYAVLKREYSYLGIGQPGTIASSMFDIGNPDLDWVLLAKGMGVPGIRLTSMDSFVSMLAEGFRSQGPTLIQVDL
jgi:acetolactate synthase I/II/III large subunit